MARRSSSCALGDCVLFYLQWRAYWVECWGAAEKPNGRIEPACITLCNQEGGPPMHHIFCDQMKRINPTPTTCTILIDLLDGHTVELEVDDEVLWRRWTKHIGLLLTIPFYPIPPEPSVGLPAEFLTDISPKAYDIHGGVCACDRQLNASGWFDVCLFPPLRSHGMGRGRGAGGHRRESGSQEQCILRGRCDERGPAQDLPMERHRADHHVGSRQAKAQREYRRHGVHGGRSPLPLWTRTFVDVRRK